MLFCAFRATEEKKKQYKTRNNTKKKKKSNQIKHENGIGFLFPVVHSNKTMLRKEGKKSK